LFNLLISNDSEAWNSSSYEFDRSRALVEYTVTEINERYKDFTDSAIEELKSFPTLFVTENELVKSHIGYITDIKVSQHSVIIDFEFDAILPTLPQGAILAMRSDIDLGRLELMRTHWAIKDALIFEILIRHGFINQQQFEASRNLRSPQASTLEPVVTSPDEFDTSQVFIVHGHDELAKLDMSKFIYSLGLVPIILHMQASSSRTIIEKIEYYSNVGFGVVLYTPCDIGHKAGDLVSRHRARQNVVFEHGFLIGKLGRPRVAAIVKGDLETPNDISGMVYIGMDEEGIWQQELIKDLRAAGYSV
jgi:predicted nucleotide-binding protein